MSNRTNEVKTRAELFTTTIKKERKPERVPILSNAWNWKFLDAGYTLSETCYDINKAKKAIRHYFQTYPTDAMFELANRNPFTFTQHFGSDTHYIIDDSKGAMNIKDESFLEPEEYDELIADPMKFVWEKFLPRKCKKITPEKNGKVYVEGMYAFIKYAMAYNGIGTMLAKEFGVPTPFDAEAPFYTLNAVDIMMDFMRGIRGLSMDMRRMPQKVKDACDALDSVYEPDMATYKGPDGHNNTAAFDGSMVYIAHTIMSAKQFEMYYYPGLKKAAEFAQAHDKTVILFVEGNSERLYDFFAELPKGHFLLQPEQNDLVRMKRELPNIAIAGGMPATLLGGNDKDACVDYAKKLVDELAYDGGYVFSSDKMLSYPTDCKRENLKAVCDFVAEYR